MDFQYYGANCIRISNKKIHITIDDNLSELASKSVTKPDDVVLFTSEHAKPTTRTRLVIDQPGEYEVSDISILGVPARLHTDEPNTNNATMYKIVIDDVRIIVTGHIYPELNDEQLEALGVVDVLIVPVGGNGYTLDGTGAHQIIKNTEPKIIIPTHYDESGLKFPVPQTTLEDSLKSLNMEPGEKLAKLKLKQTDLTDESAKLVVLEKQK